MPDFLIALLTSTAALWGTANLLPGFTIKNGLGGAALVALVLGLLDYVLRHFLFVLIGIGTLGLGFLFRPLSQWLVTTLLLVLTDKLSDTLKIRSFGVAALGALGVTVLSFLATEFIMLALG